MRSALSLVACALFGATMWAATPQKGTPVPGARVEVPPPPFTDGIFPCSQCHNKDMPANRTRRTLTDMHGDIELKHDAEHRWCLDCHGHPEAYVRDRSEVLHFGSAVAQRTPEQGLEILLLQAEPSGTGAGTALIETARQVASASGHHRLWLVTTNDNLPAIHFYLRRGLHVAAVHHDAVAADRALKPEILRRIEPSGAVARVNLAQERVLNSLLNNARFDRFAYGAGLAGLSE